MGKRALLHLKTRWLPVLLGVMLVVSFALGFHNATLYNPIHGFDGSGHIYYLEYIYKYKQIPPVSLGWETHQSPLYYLLGSGFMLFTGTWKIAQYLNIFILWALIGVCGLALHRVFKKPEPVYIGMISLAALPMLNIFPAMITNELLNTLFIVSVMTACLYLLSSKNNQEFTKYSAWVVVSFVLGLWTKVSILVTLPFILLAYIFVLKKIHMKILITGMILVMLVGGLLSAPIIVRSLTSSSHSNIKSLVTAKPEPKKADFYYRLDWIPKVDMYNTQYYSMIGGAWNSFWTDGHNTITPFVKFHKKALVLWLIGFILFPITIYGLIKLFTVDKRSALLITLFGAAMIGLYVFYNVISSHYSAARLTYEMGIVLPYAFGIATASQNKWLKKLLLPILLAQFMVMVSFYWIQSWWFSAQ